MPRVAILREQGVNGQIEMAYAFDHCGFEAIDVHMSDLMSGRQTLESLMPWLPVADLAMVTSLVPDRDGPAQSFSTTNCQGCSRISSIEKIPYH